MFVLKKNDNYSWPVSFELPTDGGEFKSESFTVIFKRLPDSRLKTLMEEIKAGTLAVDTDLAKEIVAGWEGISDGENDLPYSDKNLNQLFETMGVATSIVTAWFDSLKINQKRKN